MPNYFRVVANSRKEALEKLQRNLGHKQVTILREGDIEDKKKKWFRTEVRKAYFIECAEYRAKEKPMDQEKETSIQPAFSFSANLTSSQDLNRSPEGSVAPPPQYLNSQPSSNKLNNLVAEINRKAEMNGHLNPTPPPKAATPYPVSSHLPPPRLDDHVAERTHKDVYSFLTARDFTPKFAKRISDLFEQNLLHESSDFLRLADHISSLFSFSGIVKVKKDQPHYVFVVGPTGVGKTTTLSKIASSFYTDEEHYPKPAMIKFASLDAKRIMAMEQLRKFANILRVPFKSIYGVDDFKDLYKNGKKKELILIDTSGVSKQDNELIDEIARFTRSLKCSKEVHLCLCAQSRFYDLKKTYEVLAKIKPDRMIITKIDESYSLGSILSLLHEIRLPISYITNGQDVPIDIISGGREKIKAILLKEWGL